VPEIFTPDVFGMKNLRRPKIRAGKWESIYGNQFLERVTWVLEQKPETAVTSTDR